MCPGKFCYYIEKALAPNVTSVILDGEICPYNKKLEVLTQKGEQMNIRQLKNDDPMYQQCLYIYDILYFNGQDLTKKPLKQRLETLEQAVPEEIPGRYHLLGFISNPARAGSIFRDPGIAYWAILCQFFIIGLFLI